PPAMPTKPATTQSYFFFSSRRRHTRFSRDWSSDVCSSDLRPLLIFSRDEILSYAKQHHINWREDTSNASTKYLRNKLRHLVVPRSEERRVGKECRSRGSPSHYNIKRARRL